MIQVNIPENTYYVESILYPGLYLSYYGSKVRFIRKRADLSQHWVFQDGGFTNIDYKWKLMIEATDRFIFDGCNITSYNRKLALTTFEDSSNEKILILKPKSEHIIPSQSFRIISSNFLFTSLQKPKSEPSDDQNQILVYDLYYHHPILNPLKGQKYYLQVPFYGTKGFLAHDVSFGLSVQPMSSSESQMWHFNDGILQNCQSKQFLKFSPCANSVSLVRKRPVRNRWLFSGQCLQIFELQHTLQIDAREPSTKFIRLIPVPNLNYQMKPLFERINALSKKWSLYLEHSREDLKKKDLRDLYVGSEEEVMEIIQEYRSTYQFDLRDHLAYLQHVQDILWKSLNEKQKERVETYRSKSENKKRKTETKQIKKRVKSDQKEEKKKLKKAKKGHVQEEKMKRKEVSGEEKKMKLVSKEERRRRDLELKQWLVKIGIIKNKFYKRFKKRGIGVEDIKRMKEEELEEIVDKTSEFRKLTKAMGRMGSKEEKWEWDVQKGEESEGEDDNESDDDHDSSEESDEYNNIV